MCPKLLSFPGPSKPGNQHWKSTNKPPEGQGWTARSLHAAGEHQDNSDHHKAHSMWHGHRWRRPNPSQRCWSSTGWVRAAAGSLGRLCRGNCLPGTGCWQQEAGRRHAMEVLFLLWEQQKGRDIKGPCRAGDPTGTTESQRMREGQGDIVLAFLSQALNREEQSMPSKKRCFINDAENWWMRLAGRSCASTGVDLSALNN